MAEAKRKKCGVYLLADLLTFLREDQRIEDPGQLARAMVPHDFPADLLRKMVKAGRPKAFSALLQLWVVTRVKPPKGVFACDLVDSKGLGRPREPLAKTVYATWASMREPSFWDVARKVFPDEFKKNNKKAADRTRQLYYSYVKYLEQRTQRSREWEEN